MSRGANSAPRAVPHLSEWRATRGGGRAPRTAGLARRSQAPGIRNEPADVLAVAARAGRHADRAISPAVVAEGATTIGARRPNAHVPSGSTVDAAARRFRCLT